MTIKTYTFYDDSWYDQPPCDCCQGGWMWSFNSDQVSGNFGSASSEEDCYLQAIATESGIGYWEDVPDDLREMSYDQLKNIADSMEIEVRIIE